MQADGALPKFFRVDDAVHWISRIDRARMLEVHLDGVRWIQLRFAVLDILSDKMEILHQQSSNRHGHPAILVTMVVN